MNIPNLKRIKISSVLELTTWLAKNPDQEEDVMLVTHTKASGPNHVSHEQVREALDAHGWRAGFRYTLNATLIGHLISNDRE